MRVEVEEEPRRPCRRHEPRRARRVPSLSRPASRRVASSRGRRPGSPSGAPPRGSPGTRSAAGGPGSPRSSESATRGRPPCSAGRGRWPPPAQRPAPRLVEVPRQPRHRPLLPAAPRPLERLQVVLRPLRGVLVEREVHQEQEGPVPRDETAREVSRAPFRSRPSSSSRSLADSLPGSAARRART